MPDDKTELLTCFNRGCGQKFVPEENNKDSCTFHPGAPYFHDAYKGWSCCKKKCTDFTEFLNFKGCTTSFHNPEKPPEPEKPLVDKSMVDEVIEYRAPVAERMERPPYDTPLVELKAEVAPSLQEQVSSLQKPRAQMDNNILISSGPTIGTSCKNSACKQVYEGPHTNDTPCKHHPGYPVFHEGSKFWSCCQKRTFEFEAFLSQEGCKVDKHCWEKKGGNEKRLQCRYDWHQTGTHVVVAVYAKKYDPSRSFVKLNPVRMLLQLFFPEEGAAFVLDLELRGVIRVESSSCSMLSTKLEVKLRKAEPGSWSLLDFPRVEASPPNSETQDQPSNTESLNQDLDAVDLSDL